MIFSYQISTIYYIVRNHHQHLISSLTKVLMSGNIRFRKIFNNIKFTLKQDIIWKNKHARTGEMCETIE
jgi:DNA modification methylase